MKVVVPMAGRGSRFASRDTETPKPLVQLAGKPMIAWAVESLVGLSPSEFIFIALVEHEAKYGVSEVVRSLVPPPVSVILLDDVTEGQLCTVMAARHLIDADEDVLIASADTYVVSSLGLDIAKRPSESRGLISVSNLPGEAWSFARIDGDGWVVEVAEKQRISDYASTGLYYFSSGREFVQVADDMIGNQEKTRGEYYVIPVYQKFIERGWKVSISLASEMWDMGTPEAAEAFSRAIRGGGGKRPGGGSQGTHRCGP